MIDDDYIIFVNAAGIIEHSRWRVLFIFLGGGKVNGSTVFDYCYGDESSQFPFYRIPPPAYHRAAFQKSIHRCKAAVWPPA